MGNSTWEERSFDLKRAYRQCAIHPDHSFLRISHSLWAILVSIFGVFVSNYFDDFVALATSCETTSVTTAVTLTFKMLGWIFAETGDKAPPFASVVAALGVTIDVSSSIAAASELTTLKTGSLRLRPP